LRPESTRQRVLLSGLNHAVTYRDLVNVGQLILGAVRLATRRFGNYCNHKAAEVVREGGEGRGLRIRDERQLNLLCAGSVSTYESCLPVVALSEARVDRDRYIGLVEVGNAERRGDELVGGMRRRELRGSADELRMHDIRVSVGQISDVCQGTERRELLSGAEGRVREQVNGGARAGHEVLHDSIESEVFCASGVERQTSRSQAQEVPVEAILLACNTSVSIWSSWK